MLVKNLRPNGFRGLVVVIECQDSISRYHPYATKQFSCFLDIIGIDMRLASSDPGVFSCARGEIEPLIPRFSKGLRRWLGVKSLSGEVAHDPVYSRVWPADDLFLAQTLGRLSVSTPLG